MVSCVSYPNQNRNYCIFDEKRVSAKKDLNLLKNSLEKPKNEDEIVEDLYVLNCMLDDGEKGIAELYPTLSKYNYSKNPNSIVISGFVCKAPIYRTTPFNREIADVLIAVNRAYNKSDYIPCIAWGRNARFVKNLAVGEKIALSGRIQSREYQKKLGDDNVITLTAYEVSVSKLAVCDSVDYFDIDKEFGLMDIFRQEGVV